MDKKNCILEVVSFLDENKLEEAELKLGEIYEELAKTKLCILGKCLMAFIKGEQNKTLEKHNILDYLSIQYGDSVVFHIEHVCVALENNPVCRLVMVGLLIRKLKYTNALSIVKELIASNQLKGNLHIHALLLQADISTHVNPRDKLGDNIKMYLDAGRKAHAAGYKRVEFVTLIRVSYLIGTVLNTGHEMCIKALTRSLEFFTLYQDNVFISITNMNLGSIYLASKNYSAAETHLTTAMKQLRHNNLQYATKHLQLCSYLLACVYHSQKKDSMAYMIFADIVEQNMLPKYFIASSKNMMAECHPNKRIKLQAA